MEPLTIMIVVLCVVALAVAVVKRLLWLGVAALALFVLHQLGVWEQFLDILNGFLAEGPLEPPAFLLPFLPGKG